jgi:hypothetical protein
MDGQKPVTGSNEHHAEIERRLSAVESRLAGLEGTTGTLQTTQSNQGSSISSLDSRVRNLENSRQVSGAV